MTSFQPVYTDFGSAKGCLDTRSNRQHALSNRQSIRLVHTYINIYIYIHNIIHICIYRERAKESEWEDHMCKSYKCIIHIFSLSIYIFIFTVLWCSLRLSASWGCTLLLLLLACVSSRTHGVFHAEFSLLRNRFWNEADVLQRAHGPLPDRP